jgi:hypothetical protein
MASLEESRPDTTDMALLVRAFADPVTTVGLLHLWQ